MTPTRRRSASGLFFSARHPVAYVIVIGVAFAATLTWWWVTYSVRLPSSTYVVGHSLWAPIAIVTSWAGIMLLSSRMPHWEASGVLSPWWHRALAAAVLLPTLMPVGAHALLRAIPPHVVPFASSYGVSPSTRFSMVLPETVGWHSAVTAVFVASVSVVVWRVSTPMWGCVAGAAVFVLTSLGHASETLSPYIPTPADFQKGIAVWPALAAAGLAGLAIWGVPSHRHTRV